MQGGMTPYGTRTPAGRITPGVNRMGPTGKTPNAYPPPSMTTPFNSQQPAGHPPGQPGYGGPSSRTPGWGAQTPQQMSHMNPARAAMIQQSNNPGSQGGGGWSQR